MNNYYIGQKVVCIDDTLDLIDPKFVGYVLYGDLNGLTKGNIYTIRDIFNDPDFPEDLVCYLEEIKRDVDERLNIEMFYCITRFKPLEEKKTDISVFIKILDNINNNIYQEIE